MVSRRNLKEVHENIVLNSISEHFKISGSTLVVKSQPDPPDAFVEIDGRDTWIEITDAFYSKEVAISITSYAANNVEHRPAEGGLVADPDETISNKVESVILEKLTQQTMISIANSKGKGILLVVSCITLSLVGWLLDYKLALDKCNSDKKLLQNWLMEK